MTRIPAAIERAFDDISAPSSGEEASETLQRLASVSRRAFFGGTLAAVPATIMASASTAQAASSNLLGTNIRTAANKRYFQEIQGNEFSHLQIILAAIRSLGGTPRPYPTFRGLITSDPTTLLKIGATSCNTGASAYFGASPYIFNPNVRAVGTSLGLVEAYQSGFLNTLQQQPLIPGGQTTAVPLAPAQIDPIVAPYIVSLNDNGQFPATFSTTPSPENDIAILNFALILEYLESTLYGNSVNRVFGA